MKRSPLAGKMAPTSLLMDVQAVHQAFRNSPSPLPPVSFGTSGHRGSSLKGTFTDAHVSAIAQAVCDYRAHAGIGGPLFVGKDTHALSEPAHDTVVEVLAANGVETVVQEGGGYTPTPSISRAILAHNRGRSGAQDQADGIVLTPSHNPPEDGGCKYNPPHGGPAETSVTSWIQERANHLIEKEPHRIRRMSLATAMQQPCVHHRDLVSQYVGALSSVVDVQRIAAASVRIAVDPLGGASLSYWERIASVWGIDLTVVNTVIDPRFSFMAVDHDGKIRMDCSSADVMAPLVDRSVGFDVACANDPDADRHGIITSKGGLMDPNRYLAVAIAYLFGHRAGWPKGCRVGKTVVSSSLIDRVAESLSVSVYEVPVGFKWFVQGLFSGELGFGGEESAGASFLCMDGSPWSTDKDGIILSLLAAEMKAVTGKGPDELLKDILAQHGGFWYRRVDQACGSEARDWFKTVTENDLRDATVGGVSARRVLFHAPGNGAAIGGFKIESDQGWFAARPSGTEDIYKIYAESFESEEHLERIIRDAQSWVGIAGVGQSK